MCAYSKISNKSKITILLRKKDSTKYFVIYVVTVIAHYFAHYNMRGKKSDLWKGWNTRVTYAIGVMLVWWGYKRKGGTILVNMRYKFLLSFIQVSLMRVEFCRRCFRWTFDSRFQCVADTRDTSKNNLNFIVMRVLFWRLWKWIRAFLLSSYFYKPDFTL